MRLRRERRTSSPVARATIIFREIPSLSILSEGAAASKCRGRECADELTALLAFNRHGEESIGGMNRGRRAKRPRLLKKRACTRFRSGGLKPGIVFPRAYRAIYEVRF